MKIKVAPSLLACHAGEEKKEMQRLTLSGADWLHFDVMDGKFVPNTSFSEEDFRRISSFSSLPMDVHIMVEDPFSYLSFYGNEKAHVLTFHYEALQNDEERWKMIRGIHGFSMKAGMSIKPNTPVEFVYPFLKELDVILIMSVEPGFGGQAFLPIALDKIRALRKKIDQSGYSTLIEVDGGINQKTGEEVRLAGADVLVAGSYLFHKEDVETRIHDLKGE